MKEFTLIWPAGDMDLPPSVKCTEAERAEHVRRVLSNQARRILAEHPEFTTAEVTYPCIVHGETTVTNIARVVLS